MTIEEMVKGYYNLPVEIPKWLKKYGEKEINDYTDRERRKWLVGKILEFSANLHGNKVVIISKQKDLAFVFYKDFSTMAPNGGAAANNLASKTFLVIQKLPGSYSSRYFSGKTYDYKLIVFSDGEEIFSLTDFCDEAAYDTFSWQIPLMDLYDVLIFGERRKPPPAHTCGLQGYNPMLGDRCEGCEGT